jgi:protocatechuate 3,4-dioxygenase beta subunit
MDFNRRNFIRQGAAGLAVLGGTLLLREDAQATPSDGSSAPQVFDAELEEGAKATENNIEGPFYRKLAPYRAKVTPPLEPGKVLLITGRVWGLDTRKPLAGATLDIWQANEKGRYDNDDRANPPAEDVFVNRARLVTDEQGRYEFETIHPGSYLNGAQYRPPHIHYRVTMAKYKTLITQLYFEGDKYQDKDPFIKKSLIIKLEAKKNGEAEYKAGVFDIVLPKA